MRNLVFFFNGGRIRRRPLKRAIAGQTRVCGPRKAGQKGVHCVRRRPASFQAEGAISRRMPRDAKRAIYGWKLIRAGVCKRVVNEQCTSGPRVRPRILDA
jgi:hypothetical protein